ncbi:hypothetical protein A0256_16640 [Mucilaginibacter sp. PAMC 26640]|nr:hypothetical protein A0256_16640 [Mucilaginibacter sp. PAMC 26640]
MAQLAKPLLTIAIPTYNRAEYLKLTLQSITRQEIFRNSYDVEIVISDNCSTDETEALSRLYMEEFGNKVLYSRNLSNIGDKNFEQALSLGKGDFLKLNNDTLTHTDNSLVTMLADIKKHNESRAVIFYLNQGLDKTGSVLCDSMDQFIDRVLYMGTWIGSFGIWRDDFNRLTNFSRYSNLLLTQTDVLYRMISATQKAFVNNDLLFVSLDFQIKKKGGYDLLTVFLDNHNIILKEYLDKRAISAKTYHKFISKLLLVFFRKYFVLHALYPDKYQFQTKSKFKRIIDFYKSDYWLLLRFIITYYIYLFLKFIQKIVKSIFKPKTIN